MQSQTNTLTKLQRQSLSPNTCSCTWFRMHAPPPGKKQSFLPRTIREWNQRPLAIKTACSAAVFKDQLPHVYLTLPIFIPLSVHPYTCLTSSLYPTHFIPIILLTLYLYQRLTVFVYSSLTLSIQLSLSRNQFGRIFNLLNVANIGSRRRR